MSSSDDAFGGDPELELLSLLAEEFGAGGLDCGVAPAAGGVPAQLIVEFDDGERVAKVHICFLPEPESPAVVQYLVVFEADLLAGCEPTAARLVQLVNTVLPLPGFELSESAASLVFRYVQPVFVHPLDPGTVAWPIAMIGHSVSTYGSLLERAMGGAELTALLAEFAALQAAVLADPDDAS